MTAVNSPAALIATHPGNPHVTPAVPQNTFNAKQQDALDAAYVSRGGGAGVVGASMVTPASVGFYAALDDLRPMEMYLQRGTPAAPTNNLNPVVAIIGHNDSAGVTANIPVSTLYVAAYKYDTGTSGRATAIFCEAIDPTGHTTTFVEGIRGHGIRTTAAAAHGSAQGAVFLGQASDAAPDYVIGVEAEVIWSNGAATDAPATTSFVSTQFVANYLASNRVGVKPDALFMGNPFNVVAARAGVLLGAGSVDHTAFASKCATVYGLDLGQGTQSTAAVRMPNNTPIVAVNAVGNANLNIAYVNASNVLVLGTDANIAVVKGMIVGNATGGQKGDGTANFAGDIYKNNTAYTNPRWALQHYYTGEVDTEGPYAPPAVYPGLLPIDEAEAFTRTEHEIPTMMMVRDGGLFARGDLLLASLEEAYLYIFQLNQRIGELERQYGAGQGRTSDGVA